MEVADIQNRCQILAGSVQSVSGDFTYGGGGTGPARAPMFDEDDE